MKSGIEDRVQQVRFMAHLQYVVIILPARLMAFKNGAVETDIRQNNFRNSLSGLNLIWHRCPSIITGLIHMVDKCCRVDFFRGSHLKNGMVKTFISTPLFLLNLL